MNTNGEAHRDLALERVESNAAQGWNDAALSAIVDASRLGDFTSDDAWESLAKAGAPLTHEPRAMGAAMMRAKRMGLIVPTEFWRQSRRPETHARPVRVWRAV